MGPELLGQQPPTKESDCYALGMVIYEVLSGQAPFATNTSLAVIQMILEDKRPGRPQGEEGRLFTDAIWELLELCWKHQPSDRASAEAILLCLEGTPPLSPPPFDVDGGGEADTDYPLDATTRGSSMFSPFHPGLTLIHPCGSQERRSCMVTTNIRPHHTVIFLVFRVR